MLEHAANGRSASLSPHTITFVPADQKVRCLRDQIIVEPLDVEHSKTILVDIKTKPLRGIVKAVGPGHYPKIYNHPDKQRRTEMRDSKNFQPTELKVGDTVELGGAEHGGYSFESFIWGTTLHLLCREADVAGVICA